MIERAMLLLAMCLALAGCAGTGVSSSPDPLPDEAAADRWVEETLARLTLRQKIGQMIVPWIGGEYLAVDSDAHDRLREWIQGHGIGGLIISIGPPLEVAAKLNVLQRLADVPLLVAADMESGPGMRLRGGVVLPYMWDMGGGTRFPPLMALGAAADERLAYELGRITAIEARAVGVHMTYAPVVDVNNNPANPIINTRSYGEDPALVSRLAVAHIRGLQEHGLLATAKHFPGHGDTGVDSHIDLPVITVDELRADSVELPPYRAAIEAGVAGVMSAHIAFPALTGDSVPATLSPRLLTGLLREELGFRGLVITDALDMGGIVRRYGNGEAAVRAVQAGADVLLMPPDIGVAVDAVVRAVARGDLAEDRIDHSVRKLLAAKAALGLHRERTVELDRVPERVGGRAHAAVADELAARSITAARDRDGLLPVEPSRIRRVLSIVYTEDFDPLAGRAFHAELAEHLPGVEVEVVRLDARARPEALDSLLVRADGAEIVFVSTYLRVAAWKGEVAISEPVAAFVERIAVRRPTVVTAFGNPYVLTQFTGVGTHVLAWGQEAVVQRAAARALAGAQAITGVLPISIPPLHAAGAGLRIEPAASNRVSP